MKRGRKAKILGNKLFLSEIACFCVTFPGTVCFPKMLDKLPIAEYNCKKNL